MVTASATEMESHMILENCSFPELSRDDVVSQGRRGSSDVGGWHPSGALQKAGFFQPHKKTSHHKHGGLHPSPKMRKNVLFVFFFNAVVG